MKVKKVIFLMIILLFALSAKSNATVVQIVPGNSRATSITVSNSFQVCREMDSVLNSTLGSTELDPHLVTNADFGAVSYLANSIYGLNAEFETGIGNYGSVGTTVTIDGVSYYSTNGNATGVMNWGSNPSKTYVYTQTAALISALDGSSMDTSSDEYSYIANLILYQDTRYVETITYSTSSSATTAGMALAEVAGWSGYQYTGTNTTYPVPVRTGLFGFSLGVSAGNSNGAASGSATQYATFRPVIWNI